MRNLLLLTDYRGSFYSNIKTQRTLCSMEVNRLTQCFETAGYRLEVKRFAELDLKNDYAGVPVLYTSSEDWGLEYKGFIEDVVLTLQLAGAMLLPAYPYLRAHHNKVMMEALRMRLFPDEAKRLDTRVFGTFEEIAAADLGNSWPKVIKSAFGAGSSSVARAASREELLSLAVAMSRTMIPGDFVREMRSRIFWSAYRPRSLHRRKFIVQNFVPNLAGDFKVLRYGSRYYTLYRSVRKGDFRASGSGLFSFEAQDGVPMDALLEFSESIARQLGTPLVSLDIAFADGKFTLIEFQCLNFGTLTAEKSTHCYRKQCGRWVKVQETCDLEAILRDAVVEYLAEGVASVQ